MGRHRNGQGLSSRTDRSRRLQARAKVDLVIEEGWDVEQCRPLFLELFLRHSAGAQPPALVSSPIPRVGAPSLRSLQGRVAMLPMHSVSNRAAFLPSLRDSVPCLAADPG